MSAISTLELKLEIKELIITTLNITDVAPEDVIDNEPLFAPDNVLGLDSIDALEIIMALQRKYDVRIDDQNLARFVLNSIDTIAEFISTEKAKAKAKENPSTVE